MAQLPPRAPCKKREVGAPGPALEAAPRHQPAFAPHIAALSISAPINFLKFALHLRVFDGMPERGHPVGGQPPVVVISGAAIPLLNVGVGDALAGEMADRINDGPMERSPDINEHA